MRTTVTIDDDLLAQAKVVAARANRTLGAVMEDALREMLARQSHRSSSATVDLPESGDPREQPLVDILDKDALAMALGDEGP